MELNFKNKYVFLATRCDWVTKEVLENCQIKSVKLISTIFFENATQVSVDFAKENLETTEVVLYLKDNLPGILLLSFSAKEGIVISEVIDMMKKDSVSVFFFGMQPIGLSLE